MATTTDQRLTCEEAAQEAQGLGFREVLTMAGWRPLTDWMPYGKREGHQAITFYLATDGDGPAIRERLAKARPVVGDILDEGFCLGRWTIR